MTAEIIDHATGEVVETITESEARRLTTEARNEFRSSADHFGKAWSLIEEAVQGGGHIALGYRSPGDYLHAEFDGVLSGLDVTQRRLAVRSMTDWGLSTRAIAPVVGTSHKTVVKDTQVVPGVPPESETEPEAPESTRHARSAEKLGLIDDGTEDTESWDRPKPEPVPEPKVTGIDGKQYSRPAPKQDRRRPLADGFRDASLDLTKLITRIENLATDDRFPRNKNEVARYANDLIRARDALQCVIDQMS